MKYIKRYKSLNESITEHTLDRMEAFGLYENDVDRLGFITLYHGGLQLPDVLEKDKFFYMTPSREVAEDYVRMRGGEVFEVKVKPDDVNWNIGTYEVEFDMGGEIVDGKIYPNY